MTDLPRHPHIDLQAGAGSYIEAFYRNCGFETIFTAAGYHVGP